jgi:TATA-binding protein-associated factor
MASQSSSREQEAGEPDSSCLASSYNLQSILLLIIVLSGALALEALHKQVLPFILRRLKEDVLDDLPPKIIQDYYCDLSPLQRDLYENFVKAGDDAQDEPAVKLEDDEEAKIPKAGANGKDTHVFQTLQYLRRLVNHPSLVLQPDREDHRRILAKHGLQGAGDRRLQDIAQAPKLLALK